MPRQVSTRFAPMLAASMTMLAAGDVHAGDLDANRCVALYENGQSLVLENKLSAARAEFAQCLGSACPGLIRADCAKRYEDAIARIPSLIFIARSPGGSDLADVTVEIDGVTVLNKLTGTSTEVEPGAHHVRFIVRGEVVDDFEVIAREGEKMRPILRDVQSVEPHVPHHATVSTPNADGRPSPMPWTVYAGGSLALVGYGAFALFGLRGLDEFNALEARCAPRCAPSEGDGIRTNFVVADIALSVAIIATAATVWAYFGWRGRSASKVTQLSF